MGGRREIHNFSPIYLIGQSSFCLFSHLVSCSKDVPGYFASRLYKAMKGLGTDENTLNRVMVSRCEKDLEDIKQSFSAKNKKTLYSFIKVCIESRNI